MNCPVCNRTHAAALSICPSCGAMINDSVREELIGKISARLKTVKTEFVEIVEKKEITMSSQTIQTPNPPPVVEANAVSEISKSATGNITVKTTDSTLVAFHNKNASVPEWRLQLQNAVRQRQGQTPTAPRMEAPVNQPRTQLVTSGANALKAEIIEEPKPASHKNPDLARALDRIEKSRQKFLVAETPAPIAAPTAVVAAPKANKSYPFYIASKTSEADLKPAEVNPPIGAYAKPKLAEALKVEPKKLDTNKLPPLDPKIAENFAEKEKKETFLKRIRSNFFKADKNKEVVEAEIEEAEEYEDCPTFAMRFNAGLFDLIIGSFASLCLLAPFMLLGGNWFSGAGFFAFAATASLVMFVYMTISIGFYGRTFGMRLFSLELIDIGGEEYPTFHQAAVSSSVYLLSLAFGGLGFLPVLFNEEKRAAHDLISNTIIVRE